MSRSNFSAEDQAKLINLFENMSDSPGKDSDKLAKEWLKSHNNHFSGFINNEFLPKLEDADVIQLTNFSESFATATIASKETLLKAFDSFSEQWKDSYHLSQCLHKIAQSIEQNAELFSQVESLSSGKHLYRTRNKDVPNLIQSFHYYSSLARDPKYFYEIKRQNFIVCVIAEEFNNPMLSVGWRVASGLAAGYGVVLLVDVQSCASAFLLAELSSLSGLPAGFLNVLPIDHRTFKTFPNSADRIIFTGERSRTNKYFEMIIENFVSQVENESLPMTDCSPCNVLVSQRPVVIVYESADLHSASNGVLETLFFNDTRSPKSGCSVYVQACIREKFHSVLEEKFAKIRVGKNFTKTDMSCIVTSAQHNKLKLFIEEAQKQQQFKIVEGVDIKDETYIHWNPTLICDVPTTSKLLDKIVEGPIVITTPFRTVKESIAMFNHRRIGSDVSVWSEKLPLALEVAQNLRTRTIWINAQNLFDASVPYGGLGRSGDAIEGGKETLLQFLNNASYNVVYLDIQTYGKKDPSQIVLKNNSNIKLNYELHIGGSYKKASGGSYRIIKNSKEEPYAYIQEGSSADIEAAVLSATAAQQKWQNLGKYKRLKVLERAVDSLKAKEEEFLTLLIELTGKNARGEVNESLSRFNFWANLNNYCDGQYIETEAYGKVLQDRNPLGVIGIQIASHKPLLSFVSTVIPAIAYGNAVVVVGNDGYPIPSLKLCEILQASGVPGGTVNVITGTRSNLTRHLALNMNIDAIWYCDNAGLFILNSCITHPKKVFDYNSIMGKQWVYEKLIFESTYLKSIYMPVGDIFAN